MSLWLVGLSGMAWGQTVDVWLTTHNLSTRLQQQPSVAFASTNSGDNPLFVDETHTYQAVEGFGASFTDSAAYLLNQVATPSARTNAMRNLFTRDGIGIGVSFVRNPMGASDLARFHYSYDDDPPGGTDPGLEYFNIAHDEADIIPLIQEARQLNPQLTIMANPWSPPGWMKDSGSMIGGSLLPSMYGAFAGYFVKYVQAYEAHGIPIDYISLQNEPLYVPGDYPGMYMDADTQLTVLRDYVLPALAASGLSTRVLVYDHNWDGAYYPVTVLSDSVVQSSSLVAGTAWHGYGGTPGVMLTLANQFPTKGNYLTEHSGGTWVGDQVVNDFEEITHVMRNWGQAYVKWSLALDEHQGPNSGGCDTCNPLVTVSTATGGISYNTDFYTLGHFSKFVLPGAHRIYSANASGVVSAAFVNPDGSKALIAFNDTTASRTFEVQWGNQSFPYALASFSGATFTWTGTQTNGYRVNPANRIQASSFNTVSGLQTESTSDSLGGYDVGYADTGDYAVYQHVDFAAGFTNVDARVASAGSGGTVDFRLDSPTGPIIAMVTIPITGGWQNWQTVSTPVSSISGVHDLYLVFNGGNGIGNLNWIRFSGALEPSNHPPVLAAVADQTILAGTTLTVTNSATDPDVPPQVLTYSLPNAPAGVIMDTNSGVMNWRPTIAQSPGTQSVTVVVSDSGLPVMTATQSFQVTIARPARPALTEAAITNRQFALRIVGDNGPDYLIQTSSNLLSWSTLSTSNAPVTPLWWTDTNGTIAPLRFYRVRLGP